MSHCRVTFSLRSAPDIQREVSPSDLVLLAEPLPLRSSWLAVMVEVAECTVMASFHTQSEGGGGASGGVGACGGVRGASGSRHSSTPFGSPRSTFATLNAPLRSEDAVPTAIRFVEGSKSAFDPVPPPWPRRETPCWYTKSSASTFLMLPAIRASIKLARLLSEHTMPPCPTRLLHMRASTT